MLVIGTNFSISGGGDGSFSSAGEMSRTSNPYSLRTVEGETIPSGRVGGRSCVFLEAGAVLVGAEAGLAEGLIEGAAVAVGAMGGLLSQTALTAANPIGPLSQTTLSTEAPGG